MVLEADPDRESYVKRWASGEVESTRAVRQSQSTLDEEAIEEKSKASAEDLGEEEPSDAKEAEKKMERKKMRRTRVTPIRVVMMTTTPKGWGHPGTRTPQVETTLCLRKQRRPRRKKNQKVAMSMSMVVVEIQEGVQA